MAHIEDLKFKAPFDMEGRMRSMLYYVLDVSVIIEID